MNWGKRLWGGVIWVTLLVVAVPPATAAKVRSFTDKRGVIHITTEAEAFKTEIGPENPSDDISDIKPEPPGNFPDETPRDKRYKLRVLYDRKIVLPH
jgi:hypothetical protein